MTQNQAHTTDATEKNNVISLRYGCVGVKYNMLISCFRNNAVSQAQVLRAAYLERGALCNAYFTFYLFSVKAAECHSQVEM